MGELLHIVVDDGTRNGTKVYYISEGAAVSALDIPGEGRNVEIRNMSGTPIDVRVQQPDGTVIDTVVGPDSVFLELGSPSTSGQTDSDRQSLADHDLPIESDPIGNAIPGLIVTGIGSAVEGVFTAAGGFGLKLVGELTGEAIVIFGEAGESIGPGRPGFVGSDTPLTDTGVYIGELGDAINVHDLPDAPVVIIDVHGLPDAPVDVHDLPDDPGYSGGGTYIGEVDDPGFNPGSGESGGTGTGNSDDGDGDIP